MHGIMASMDQKAWFSGFLRCSSRCVPFSVLRPKMPVFMAGMDHRTVRSSQCISWTRFCTCPLLCYVLCIGPDSAVLAVPQLQFIKVVGIPC